MVVAIAGEAPRSRTQAKTRNVRSLGKRPHLLEPLPPSKLGTEQWADRPMPVQRANLCPCFLPVNSVDGCERLLPACRQEIGYFSLHLLRCSSVHLIDKRLATDQVLRRRWGRKPFPLQRPVASRMGEKCQVLWIWSWMEKAQSHQSVPGMINDTEAQRSGQMRGSQHGERRRVRLASR